jgi:hypothetical protein
MASLGLFRTRQSVVAREVTVGHDDRSSGAVSPRRHHKMKLRMAALAAEVPPLDAQVPHRGRLRMIADHDDHADWTLMRQVR